MNLAQNSCDAARISTIDVPERGSISIDASVYNKLKAEQSFWDLVQNHVIKVAARANDRYELLAGGRIGVFVFDSIRLRIREKISGGAAALLKCATPERFRNELPETDQTTLGPLFELICASFLAATFRYADRGRQFVFEDRQRVAPLAGGKLKIGRTIREWSRGRRHLLVFAQTQLSHATPVNRAIRTVLNEIESVAQSMAFGKDLVMEARRLKLLFSDAPIDLHRLDAQSVLSDLEGVGDWFLEDIARFGSMILAARSFDIESEITAGTSPNSWSINLEWLFEQAARLQLAQSCRGSVRKPATDKSTKFVFDSQRYSANPDILIDCDCGKVVVGDLKYKEIRSMPDAGDIYQLLVHATAYGASDAFLAFPGDTFERKTIGNSVTGQEVDLFWLNVRDMRADVAKVSEYYCG